MSFYVLKESGSRFHLFHASTACIWQYSLGPCMLLVTGNSGVWAGCALYQLHRRLST